MKTSEVRTLVLEALQSLPRPYTEHVIDDVFHAIETTTRWRSQYDVLCTALGRTVVNNWCGRWIGIELGKVGEKQVPSRKNSLAASYSLLDTDAKVVARKPNEPEALKMMADYYKANKLQLPIDVRRHRDLIVELLMDGMSPEEAFLTAMKGDA